MKSGKYGFVKILSVLFCLLSMNLCGICQSDTATVNLSEILPKVVRDLRLCDQIKAENDVIWAYNAQLSNVNAANLERIQKLTTEQLKYRDRARRRGRINAGFFTIVAANVALIWIF